MLGPQHYTRPDLEAIRDAGELLHIRVWAWSASPRMSRPNCGGDDRPVEVLGAFRASTAVKALWGADPVSRREGGSPDAAGHAMHCRDQDRSRPER